MMGAIELKPGKPKRKNDDKAGGAYSGFNRYGGWKIPKGSYLFSLEERFGIRNNGIKNVAGERPNRYQC